MTNEQAIAKLTTALETSDVDAGAEMVLEVQRAYGGNNGVSNGLFAAALNLREGGQVRTESATAQIQKQIGRFAANLDTFEGR